MFTSMSALCVPQRELVLHFKAKYKCGIKHVAATVSSLLYLGVVQQADQLLNSAQTSYKI